MREMREKRETLFPKLFPRNFFFLRTTFRKTISLISLISRFHPKKQ